jgi:DNA-binding CsgD family transcriptional regulator
MFVCDMASMKPVFARLTLFTDKEAEAGESPPEQLSPRELEVLRLVAQGFDNRRIAEQLVLSEGTVKAHVSHILAKLSVSTRTALVRYALTHEVFPSEPFEADPAMPASRVGVHRHVTVRVTAKAAAFQRTGDEDKSGAL